MSDATGAHADRDEIDRVLRRLDEHGRAIVVLHYFLGLESFAALEGHPKLGASWEGFALEEVLRITGSREAYFWATHAGAELDLLAHWRGKRWGFEFKYSDAPGMTKSMHIALEDLRPERLFVIYPGKDVYPLHDHVEVLARGHRAPQ